MEKIKKTTSSNNNDNNIEKQIFSMLENVLKEDSDDSNNSDNKKLKNIKSQQNKNRLNLNFQNRDKLDYAKKEVNFNLNFQKKTELNNMNLNKNINQPQIFINNIPVSNENDQIDNREFILRNKNNCLNTMYNPMPHFNNLSPISKQMKNQSPRNYIEDNMMKKPLQPPITNRLTVAHIGLNMGYNNQIRQNSPKNNVKAHPFIRNNTINHSISKLCLNNNDNTSSTCTTNR